MFTAIKQQPRLPVENRSVPMATHQRVARILEKAMTTANTVCAHPNAIQCEQLIAFSADENVSAIVALVNAPNVAGPITDIAEIQAI